MVGQRTFVTMTRVLFAPLVVLLTATAAQAQPLAPDEVPEPLRPWVPWVLETQRDFGCTFLGGERVCTWPGELSLSLGANGGSFRLDVVADRETMVTLPGDAERFPQDVRIDGAPRPVVDGPHVRVGPGAHRIEGSFRWTVRPDILPVPPSVARVALVLDGTPIRTPRREDTGAVWLARPAEGATSEGHFEMEVFRKIEDGTPFRVVTHIAVRAAGEPRELALGNALLPGMIPTDLSSDLAVRLAPDGTLRAQVHAGTFAIEVSSVAAAPPDTLAPPAQQEPWPETEVWVWAANESLRQVELEGAPSVDPARTNLPDEWRSYPAYVLTSEHTLAFTTTRRGEPMPPPSSLSLARELWLDLDGEGYTVRDTLSGQMTQRFRLDLTEGRLGHAVVAGRDQLVTTLDGMDGIEVRARAVDVRAEWRLPEARTDLPAVGWSEDVQSLSTTLRLPPGYTLIGATGVDDAPGTWIEQWDLWGLFFVVLVTVAIGRIFGWPYIALALPLLVLAYHEEGAPLWTWVVLAAVAGVRSAWRPGTWGARISKWVYFVVLGVLVLIAVPFATDQMRFALYPQTEDVQTYEAPSGATTLALGAEDMPMPQEAAPVTAFEQALDEEASGGQAEIEAERAGEGIDRTEQDFRRGRVSRQGGYFASSGDVSSRGWVDPNEVIQTGPGIPEWSHTSWPLRWTGPVVKDHRIGLYLLSPFANRMLSLLRVLLLAALVIVVARHRFRPRPTPPKSEPKSQAVAAAAIALLAAFGASHAAQAQEVPNDAVLEQLRERLTRPPECVPSCTVPSEMTLRIAGDRAVLEATVHASARAAYRVPGPTDAWVPEGVTVDGRDEAGLLRHHDGFLYLRLEPGVHRVRLEGPIPMRDALTLAFVDPPRSMVVDADGWEVEGLRADGRVSETIQLRRTVRSGDDGEAEQAPLASWLVVTRRLDVGVRWTLQSTVERVTPTGTAVVIRIPLLEGESVTDAGVITERDEVVVTLGRDDTTRTWTSVIEPREELTLTAPADVRWSETWTLACSPIWRCAADGLAPVSHESGGMWEPTYRPWPGESLTLAFARPEAATGQSVTIDNATLKWEPGVRMLDATLDVVVRTSSGGAQVITLPEGARVQSLEVDGTNRPVQLDDDKLRVTLQPGSQSVCVRWQQPMELGTVFDPPAVDLGSPAVNARVEVILPQDRWLIWTSGPSWGAAVLFWAYLALVLLVALLLARIRRSPLPWWDWALLGLGLSQLPPPVGLIVVGWFFAVAWRGRTPDLSAPLFDLRQLALVFYTLVAAGCLYAAVHVGLLMDPDMEVFTPGHGGSRHLDWYTDRIGPVMPDVAVVSLPMWIWRLVMLAWALWLAIRVIKWARWGFTQFTVGGVWKKLTTPRRPRPAAATAPAAAAHPVAPVTAPAPTTAPASSGTSGGTEEKDAVSEKGEPPPPDEKGS